MPLTRNWTTHTQNLGTIKCSNLCTEIVEYTSPEETAVCNLASIALPRYVREKDIDPAREPKKLCGSLDAENRCVFGVYMRACSCVWMCDPGHSHLSSPVISHTLTSARFFDFNKLAEVTAAVTRNLNQIIDINYYPVETARRSNMRHRPIGIGCQGLADAFILMGMAFDSPEVSHADEVLRAACVCVCVYVCNTNSKCAHSWKVLHM